MESAKVRSISKEISVEYLRSQIETWQRFLERFRRCKCLEFGEQGCNCVNEDDEEVSNRCEGFYQDSSSQTDLMHGESFFLIKVM